MDKPITHQDSISDGTALDGRRNTPPEKAVGHSVVNGDPTRLEPPDGVSEKTVVRKW